MRRLRWTGRTLRSERRRGCTEGDLCCTSEQTLNLAAAAAPAAGSGYWLADIKRQGVAPYNPNKDAYKVFRNVKDYGAVGDGTTDDTAAINKAVSDGERCGEGCDSSTTTPAIVYFPAGTYAVSEPIIQYYYTQFVGDINNLPTIKATAAFEGMAVMDADPYIPGTA